MPDWPADLLVLIPVYNHAGTVATVASDAAALGAPVLVVDDGSSDGSGDAAATSGATLVRHERNRGKAQALLTGMHWAWQQGYQRVLTVDADGQHPIPELPKLVAAGARHPQAVVIGRRDMATAPLSSRVGRVWSNLSVWSTCGSWPGDSQSGLRIYPLAAILRLPLHALGYTFEIEVLARAGWAGVPLTWVTVDVLYPDDRITHFHKWRDNYRAIRSWVYLLGRRCSPLPQRLRPLPARRLHGDEEAQDSSTADLDPDPARSASSLNG